MSFVTKSGYKVSEVFDIRAVVEGIPAFYIVKVEKSKAEEFQAAVDAPGALDLTAWGEVLHYGIKEPDAALKAELHKKYGMYEEAA